MSPRTPFLVRVFILRLIAFPAVGKKDQNERFKSNPRDHRPRTGTEPGVQYTAGTDFDSHRAHSRTQDAARLGYDAAGD